MQNTPKDMSPGTIHKTNNCGDIKIVKYNCAKSVVVRFIHTGHEKETRSEMIRTGMVKDPFSRSVYGVGYYGVGKHSFKESKKYNTWIGMFQRCYSEKWQNKYPTYKGCTVCNEWHNYQVFGDWFDDNYQYGSDKNELDKDLLSGEIKIYSPATCLFLTRAENIQATFSGEYKMISPDGDVINIINMSEFCRENDLHRGDMCLVHQGLRNQHKGWTKA